MPKMTIETLADAIRLLARDVRDDTRCEVERMLRPYAVPDPDPDDAAFKACMSDPKLPALEAAGFERFVFDAGAAHGRTGEDAVWNKAISEAHRQASSAKPTSQIARDILALKREPNDG